MERMPPFGDVAAPQGEVGSSAWHTPVVVTRGTKLLNRATNAQRETRAQDRRHLAGPVPKTGRKLRWRSGTRPRGGVPCRINDPSSKPRHPTKRAAPDPGSECLP